MKEGGAENKTGLNRREFLVLTVTAAVGAGCQAVGTSGGGAAQATRTVDAGPVSNYAADGVYDAFRDQGFFVIRKGGKLSALSSICTHRQCKLNAQPDHSFYCPCHGSTFDPAGKVTQGPATRDLPVLPATAGVHLLVKVMGA